MKAFRFSLERVKRVREIERDLAKAEWAQAINKQADAERELIAYREAASAKSLGLIQGANFNHNAFKGVTIKTELRLQAVADATERLEEAKTQVTSTQQALAKAQQQVDGMDRLKTAQLLEWQAEFKTEEAKENDDIVVTRLGAKLAKERKAGHTAPDGAQDSSL